MRQTVYLAAFFFCTEIFAQAQWRAGLAEVNITPQEPIFLAGYASRNKPSEGVLTDLFVKVLALEDAAGQRGVLITSDLIGFPAEVSEPICERIRAKTGLERARILLNSSHTHTGPVISAVPRPSENMPEAEARKVAAYTHKLQDQIVDAAERALARLEPADLSWGTGVAFFVMNRREHTENGVILGVNPRGPADRSVPVLRVSAPDGKLRAILFGAACHNTTLTGQHYQISGDYAGFAQRHVQENLPGVQAMFMLGCGGDANPYPRGTVESAQEHGRSLGAEVLRVLAGKLQPIRGPLGAAFDYSRLPLRVPPSPEQIKKAATEGRGIQQWVAQRMQEFLARGEKLPTYYDAPVAVWQFGPDLTLVGLSGEVVVDYVYLLQNALGPLNLWVAGYCNDVFGYFPSARVLREGGYETRGLIRGGIGYFDPAAQDVLVQKVTELVREARRR